MSEQIEIVSKRYIYILLFSFIPFIIKGFTYLDAGSYTPMILMAILGFPIFFGVYSRKLWVFRLVKPWAILMILFGIARLVLEILFYFSPSLQEVHIREQFTLWFNLISFAHMFVGFYLYGNLNSSIIKVTHQNST